MPRLEMKIHLFHSLSTIFTDKRKVMCCGTIDR